MRGGIFPVSCEPFQLVQDHTTPERKVFLIKAVGATTVAKPVLPAPLHHLRAKNGRPH
jgi:hypothetical protein